jgi:carbamoyl-phosphate synthase small subunit
MKAKLVLENGLVVAGESFGAPGEVTGELVFNTSLTGYQEILTDPSYCGQIVAMTYPLIGNYGINPDDMEGIRPSVSALLVKEYSEFFSNFRATSSLGDWLKQQNVVALQGLDTRMLTKVIRDGGAMRAIISTTDHDEKSLLAKVLNSPRMNGQDLTSRVTCPKPFDWNAVDRTPFALALDASLLPRNGAAYHVVVYDFGVKYNILRRLAGSGCRLTVVPTTFPAGDALGLNPDVIFLSNGPGDPEAVRYGITTIGKLLDKKPVFGICLGHQLLALALGGKTYKLKFGHRGANHPVKNLLTDTIEITSQNHGFAVDADSLDVSTVDITHVNLNDGTNEGLRHREWPVFSVQYHPEASPGPHDSDYLFRQFIGMMKEHASALH